MELSELPSVAALSDAMREHSDLPPPIIVAACQEAIDQARQSLKEGGEPDPASAAVARLDEIESTRLRNVINATGVLLHTNLGRAPLNAELATAAGAAASSAGNVEMDLRSGLRSSRSAYMRTILPIVTAAEDGFAVNNNAGALLLAIASVARGGRVAVSRGELIEIGGSFRLPDLMAAAGTELVEVGTTNRTRLSDYERVADSVDALLKVHPSNYRVEGFQEEASYADLGSLARTANIPFIADVGSGLVDEAAPWLTTGSRQWLAKEPGVMQTVLSGADLVLFSGDKLLGGPQAGILVGTSNAVGRAMADPIARALRLDGSTIASLTGTLEMYADQRVLEIPFWAMASLTPSEVGERASAVLDGSAGGSIIDGESIPGAGSVPGATIPTKLIVLPGPAEVTHRALAEYNPPIIASRRDMSTVVDMRSVLPRDDHHVAAAIRAMLD